MLTLRHHHPVGSPEFSFLFFFFFPSAIFRQKGSFKFENILSLFSFILGSILFFIYFFELFIFFLNTKWALTCRLSSVVESFDKLFLLTFQIFQDFCKQPSFRWRNESNQMAKNGDL